MALPSDCNSNFCSSQISAKHRGVCPYGWHIPSRDEWMVLLYFVDQTKKLIAANGWDNKGKGTDNYGFSALPGGNGVPDGNFQGIGDSGVLLSASERNNGLADVASGVLVTASFLDLPIPKSYLFSVRCLQD